MRSIIILFAALVSLPALAQDIKNENANAQIRIDKAACRAVTRHVPDADVAYKPGVDVNGRPVVPADIDPPTDYHLDDSFELRLTSDAAKAFGLKVPQLASTGSGSDPNAPGVTTDTVFGYITLKHGKAYLNGKPLDNPAQNQLAILCKSHKAE